MSPPFLWRPETAGDRNNGNRAGAALARTNGAARPPAAARATNGGRVPSSTGFGSRAVAEGAVQLFLWSALTVTGSLVALAGVLGLVGDYPRTSDRLLDFIGRLGSAGAAERFRDPVESLVRDSRLAAALLVAGTLATVWFASGYLGRMRSAALRLGADGRRSDHRPRMPLRDAPGLLLSSLVAALVLAAIVLTGPPAKAAVEALGHGERALTVWSIGKWPLLAASFSTLFVIFYCTILNPKPAGLRAVSAGQLVTAVGWSLALTGLAFHVAHFNAINETYGGFGAAFLSLLWLTLLSVLYYVTPSLRVNWFGAVMPGLCLALTVWLAASAGLAASVVVLHPFGSFAGALVVAWLALGWLWASNLALLGGAAFNLELDERRFLEHVVEPQTGMRSRPNHTALAPDLREVVSSALRDELAHDSMWSVLAGDSRDVPNLLSELECDLNDWGFAYGVAWALAKARYPLESGAQVAARALEAAEAVFCEYCDDDDWPERLAERRAGQIAYPELAGNGHRAGVPG